MTAHSDIVIYAARNLAGAAFEGMSDSGRGSQSLDEFVNTTHERFIPMVMIVLKAIVQPTQEMVDAAKPTCGIDGTDLIIPVYRAMILSAIGVT